MTTKTMTWQRGELLSLSLLLAATACGGGPASAHVDGGSSDGGHAPHEAGVGGGGGRAPHQAGADGGGIRDAGAAPVDSGASENRTDAGSGELVSMTVGAVDMDTHAESGLPPLPGMVNVVATAIGDAVSISFDPIDEASDYRVYELPSASDVTVASDGQLTVQHAVYRCAGNRQAPAATLDGATQVGGGAIRTLVDGQSVGGYVRMLADATMGYVYPTPSADRVPVYALGEHDARGDNECYFQRWKASRAKRYVTSESERHDLIAQGFRDDGIVFYVPATESDATRQVFTATSDDSIARYYFTQGPEASKRSAANSAFLALTTQADGSVPLMRVYYENGCGKSHDELVAGKARFELARRQGDQLPLTRLHWSGLSKSTTLVVEALDQGCPFQGLIAPSATAAYTEPTFGTAYQPWLTPDDVQKNSEGHELFINGQFDGTKPRPIARSFVKISPAPVPSLDWSFGFSATDSLGMFADIDCGAPDKNCFGQHRLTTDTADAEYFNVETARYTQGQLFGEWWVVYSDLAADTTGKYRLTPKQKANMAADSFLYVSMDVDAFTSLRRYPQLLISDRDAPIQYDLQNGNTLIVQTFNDWPSSYELQVCDHRTWDVNDQCPRYDMYRQHDPADDTKVVGLAPNVELGDEIGMDYSNRFEIYVSTRRAYLFLDGRPYACADLPTSGVPSGPVTVTYGDVLYHSGVDNLFTFTKRRLQNDSVRHFDNLGFKSGMAAPAWDEARLPCAQHLMDP